MKKIILIIVAVLILLSIYPIWRYYSNAKTLANTVMTYSSGLGSWSNSGISAGMDGKITVRRPVFTPSGYAQSFEAEEMVIKADAMFILKSSKSELKDYLPDTMTISVNSIVLDSKSDDIYGTLKNNSLWKLQAGYAGSFGCTRELYTEFDDLTWSKIIPESQSYNIDLFYSRQANGSIDADLTLDVEGKFTSTWSANLKPSFNDRKIVVNDLLIDKIFYYYLDYGFNEIRNSACAANNKDSFAAYRISSVEQIQKYLRTNYIKEMPKDLLTLYQKLLAPDAEYNIIFKFPEKEYIGAIYSMPQVDFYTKTEIEISTDNNKYKQIELTDIDYTKVDSEQLLKEHEIRERKKKEEEQARIEAEKNKNKPVVYTIGGNKATNIPLNKISSVIGKRVRIKTLRGRPVTGYLLSVDNNLVELDSIFRTGRAKITLPLDKVSSVELVP